MNGQTSPMIREGVVNNTALDLVNNRGTVNIIEKREKKKEKEFMKASEIFTTVEDAVRNTVETLIGKCSRYTGSASCRLTIGTTRRSSKPST
jgi:hypothetical protein